MFEKEKNKLIIQNTDSINHLNKQNIEKEILPLLIEISQSNVFTLDNVSHKKLFDDVFELIKENPDKYEILALTFFPILLEKVCYFKLKTSSEFYNLIENFNSNSNKRKKDNLEKLTTNEYLHALKDLLSSSKYFQDVIYFNRLRNDLIHNLYSIESMTQTINNSKEFLKLIILVIKSF
jgi:hypothetical protein